MEIFLKFLGDFNVQPRVRATLGERLMGNFIKEAVEGYWRESRWQLLNLVINLNDKGQPDAASVDAWDIIQADSDEASSIEGQE